MENFRVSLTSVVMKEFFRKYYNPTTKHFCGYIPCIKGNLICFVITNHTMNWENKEFVKSEFKDRTYNHFLNKDLSFKNIHSLWWKQEFLRDKHFEVSVDNIEEKNCPICLEPLKDDIVITKCGHYFNKKCLSKWNEKNVIPNNHNCPLCRTKNKKWFPFYKDVFYKKEIKVKECERITRCYDEPRRNIVPHKCNCSFTTCGDNNFCFICRWDNYCKKTENVYIENTDLNDVIFTHSQGDISDGEINEESWTSSNSDDSGSEYNYDEDTFLLYPLEAILEEIPLETETIITINDEDNLD